MEFIKKYRQASEVEQLIPLHLRGEAERMVSLFKTYYEFLADNYTSKIEKLPDEHDLYRCSEPFLSPLHDLIAKYIPNSVSISKRDKLKILVKYFYNNRGSLESVNTFFRVFYNTYGIIDMPADPRNISQTNIPVIDEETYKAWKPYSYNVYTDIPLKEWKKPWLDLIHPIGYKFFAFLLIIRSNKNEWTDEFLPPDIYETIKRKEDLKPLEVEPIHIFSEKLLGYTIPGAVSPVRGTLYPNLIDAQGYNPHPQIGWIKPFDTKIDFETEGYIHRVNKDYLDFVKFYDTKELKETETRTLDKLLEYGHNYYIPQLANISSIIATVNGDSLLRYHNFGGVVERVHHDVVNYLKFSVYSSKYSIADYLNQTIESLTEQPVFPDYPQGLFYRQDVGNFGFLFQDYGVVVEYIILEDDTDFLSTEDGENFITG